MVRDGSPIEETGEEGASRERGEIGLQGLEPTRYESLSQIFVFVSATGPTWRLSLVVLCNVNYHLALWLSDTMHSSTKWIGSGEIRMLRSVGGYAVDRHRAANGH